jgi:hypothetical protein
VLIRDKGYLSVNIQLNILETANIQLQTSERINQTGFYKQLYIFKKAENE